MIRKEVLPALLTGHPRFGSKYLSKAMFFAGMPVGHERAKQYGAVSWLSAVDDMAYPFGDPELCKRYRFLKRYVYMRDPISALPSCVIENGNRKSYAFRRKHIAHVFGVDLDDYEDPVDRAVASIVHWYRICELRGFDGFVRIDDRGHLQSFLTRLGARAEGIQRALGTPRANTSEVKWPSREKPKLSQEMLTSIRPELKEALDELRADYGYSAATVA